ncbi:MAG: MFS transporter, partial [Acidobacteria bacterium]|nr:MFS transporter [Acidobacteriota bacterium]
MEAQNASQTILPETLSERARRRSFWSLFATQFQGAFSDNAFKNLVVFFILGMGLSQTTRDTLIPVVGALFALPFILFSMAGGYLADRHSKRAVTVWTKVAEVAVMALGLVALTLGNLPFLLGVVFLMSAQSAFFGPSKWGLLPELLPERRLSWGNGVLDMGTFLASIVGTVAGAAMSETFRGQQSWSGAIFVGLAALGLLTSLGIYKLLPADPNKKFRLNFVSDLIDQIRLIRLDRTLFLAVLGNTYFLFLASLLQVNIILYGKDVLRVSDTQNGYMQAAIAIGIGVGSLAAGYLSGNKIEYGLVPLGSIGIVGLAFALSLPGLSLTVVLVELALLGFFGGFFIVPIAALIQHRPAKEHKGGVIAASNLLSWVGYFIATGFYYLLTALGGLTPPRIFQVGAAITLAGTAYVVYILPDSLLRLLLWMLTHTFYRIRVVGRDHIPEKGGALFVSNHLSFV